MKGITYGNGEVFIGEEPLWDTYQAFVKDSSPVQYRLGFMNGQGERVDGEPDPESERTYFRDMDMPEATLSFERNRKRVEPSLQKVMGFVFDHFELPREEGILDIGSGATGFNNNALRPKDVPPYLQLDLNPRANRVNAERYTGSWGNIAEGSYYDLPRISDSRFELDLTGKVSMVTGLSSLDTASRMGEAMDRIAETLQGDGFLAHVQDVRPGPWCVLSFCKSVYGENPTQAYLFPGEVLIGYNVKGEAITTVELFRRAIGKALEEHPRFELLCNSYVTLVEPIQSGLFEYYFFNTYGKFPTPFLASMGCDFRSRGIPENLFSGARQTTVLATVARKVK